MGSIIRVEAPDRHPQRLLGIVVAGPAYHPPRTGLGRLAAVIRAVGVGAILAGRPLPQVAEEVLDPPSVRCPPGAGRPARSRCRDVRTPRAPVRAGPRPRDSGA